MNNTNDNRWVITSIFAELEQGNSQPFVDALADNVRWTQPGSSAWSRTFEGKPAVLDQLLAAVRSQLVERVRLSVRRILADDDHVSVEAKGQATTKSGTPYNNDYCFVFRLADRKIIEITEYMDTHLATTALVAPWPTPA